MDRPDPRPIYEERLGALRALRADLDRLDDRFAQSRLAVFVALLAAAWWAFVREGPAVLAGAALLGFVSLIVLHARAIARRDRADLAIAHFERGLRRLDDAWTGEGCVRADLFPPDHPFAADLDLAGRGSLMDLLGTARTRAGEETLARWLAEPADRATVLPRQGAVEELRGRVDLREDLAVLGGRMRAAVDPASLLAWAGRPAPLAAAAGRVRFAAFTGSAAVAAAGIGAGVDLWSGWWFIGALGFSWALSSVFAKRIGPLMEEVSRPAEEFLVLRDTLRRLEAERFAAPALVDLRERLLEDDLPASAQVDALLRRVGWLEALRNQFAAPLVVPLLLHLHAALAVDLWRARHGAAVARWLAALGEMEALVAVSGYAFEHPRDPFPEIVDGEALFEGRGLGHPLVPERGFVRNDVSLRAGPPGAARLRVSGGHKWGVRPRGRAPGGGGGGVAAPTPARARPPPGPPPLLLVSGSNMSGKSTLLRTVGINAVLARCGAPVRAASLRMGPLRPGATLRIHDSLHDGRSRFMAELERLRVLVDLAAGPAPLLFLLDEVFAGTNSHDRRIGAAALLAALVERGAVGLVSTHDLALSEAVAPLGARAAEVHFEDRLEGGRLVFDYVMRPGVVRRSNAVDLMRAVGLPV